MKHFRPGVYKHFKGRLYSAFRLVAHSETECLLVLYCNMEDGSYWVRPLDNWLETVDRDGCQGPRFQYVKGLQDP